MDMNFNKHMVKNYLELDYIDDSLNQMKKAIDLSVPNESEKKNYASMRSDLKKFPSTIKHLLTIMGLYIFTYKSYSCSVRRNDNLSWNGYVLIKNPHSIADLNECQNINFDVHGGVTYFENNILGFDCGHAGDYTLSKVGANYGPETTYKDYNFVISEVKKLVDDLINKEQA
jgi:hypothetical protein